MVEAIVGEVADVAGVLEVGPGPGVLTQPLSAGRRVIAYEVDPVAISALAESAPDAEIRHQDVLTVDLAPVLASLPSPRAIVSNMPYNITGPLLEAFAEQRAHVQKCVLMMQAEVGEKILAAPGDRLRGSVSVNLQAQFHIQRLCKAPAGCFFPPPKVDSIVLVITPRGDEPPVDYRMVRAAFRQPRKTLANNLRTAGWSREVVAEVGLSPEIRPHQLTEANWLALSAATRAQD